MNAGQTRSEQDMDGRGAGLAGENGIWQARAAFTPSAPSGHLPQRGRHEDDALLFRALLLHFRSQYDKMKASEKIGRK